MPLTTAKRLIRSGFTNFFRNIWLSLAATSIMVITLFTVSTILVLSTLTGLALQNIQDRVGITAYFNKQTSEREILNVKAEIELMPDVQNVEYIPNTIALDTFRELHKNEPLLLETLNEFKASENPLPNTFAIRAATLESYAQIADTLRSDRYAPYFDKIKDNNKVITRLSNITTTIKNFGLILAAVFFAVTIMVMFNTIRLTIYNRRQEVEIMRLVGATNWYIRTPFIIEGVMYGLIATIITSGVMFLIMYFKSEQVQNWLSLDSTIAGNLTWDLIIQIVLVNLVVGVGLGVIASTIAMRRYLKI
jgi:cell division transport system permease protein